MEKAEGITKTPCKATTGSWQKIWVRLITKKTEYEYREATTYL